MKRVNKAKSGKWVISGEDIKRALLVKNEDGKLFYGNKDMMIDFNSLKDSFKQMIFRNIVEEVI